MEGVRASGYIQYTLPVDRTETGLYHAQTAAPECSLTSDGIRISVTECHPGYLCVCRGPEPTYLLTRDAW